MVVVDVKNGAEVQDVDNFKYEAIMIIVKGFINLVAHCENFVEPRWFFVEKSFNNASKDNISNSSYYIAADDDEEFDLEDNAQYKTFLDTATFKAIIDNKLEHHPQATNDELLEAVVYYLENDDFLD
jgi:hypothetical protein